MKSSSVIKRITALSLALLMVTGMTACGKKEEEAEETQTKAVNQPVYTAAPDTVSKKETVYVNLGRIMRCW